MSNSIIPSLLTGGTAAIFGGSIQIATIPTVVTTTASAGGLAGLLGFTTTTTAIVSAPVTVPVAGVIAVGAMLTYGGYEVYDKLIKPRGQTQNSNN